MPRLLVPFDGSDSALRALHHGIALAMFAGDVSVHLVTVLRAPPASRPLALAERLVREAGVIHTGDVLVGEIVPTLLRRATEIRCDAILMGSRGLGESGFAGPGRGVGGGTGGGPGGEGAPDATPRRGLGSVAAGVLDLAWVPVTLVR
jgi:nucleotide-binding universal stress UspA family protein